MRGQSPGLLDVERAGLLPDLPHDHGGGELPAVLQLVSR